MTDDEPIITTGNPGLPKLALWLLGLVTSLGAYVWQGATEKIHQLESAHSADHETISELRRQVAVMAEHGTAVEAKVDRILTIVERRQR